MVEPGAAETVQVAPARPSAGDDDGPRAGAVGRSEHATAGGGTDGEDVAPGGEARNVVLRAWDAVTDRPLLVGGTVAALVAGAHAIWIWNHRHLGGFDPDEASYLSTALRIHRSIDPAHPLALLRAVLANGHGVSVPVLSVPLLLVGPRDPRTAMMIQPLLLVFVAVATAGITRKLAGNLAAIVAAAWVVLVPTVTTAVQSYWYGLGAAAAMAGAMWALLTSDGGRNRRVWLYGVAVGVMLLSRTMTLGYLPACAVAGLVVAWPDRHALKRVVAAVAIGVGIASPWYLINRGAIFGYLFSFGYGDNAALFGQTGLSDRLSLRWERFETGFGVSGILRGAILTIALAMYLYLLGRWLLRRSPEGFDGRGFAALSAAILVGTAALVSTANNGVWFELPLVVLGASLLVSAAAHLPRLLSVPMALVVLASAASTLPAALWLTTWEAPGAASHYEWGFSEYDERFEPSRRDEHPEAARDWWRASRRIQEHLRDISPDGRSAVFVVAGNTHLWNSNTIRMSSELDGWDPELWIPDTTKPPADRRDYLTPTVRLEPGRRAERVLVVGDHDQILWPLDAEVRSFVRQAERSGYAETERFPLPRGGDVVVYRQEAR